MGRIFLHFIIARKCLARISSALFFPTMPILSLAWSLLQRRGYSDATIFTGPPILCLLFSRIRPQLGSADF